MSRETKGYVGFGIAEESRLKRLQGSGGMSVGGRRDRMRAGARRASGFYRAVATVFMLLCSLLVTAQAAETVTYYYTSPQGTVLATADSAGNVLSSADYRPYGSQALGTPEQGPGYTGHVNDVDSGLVYMQARYYDPAVGRFLSTDPGATSPGNVFAYNRFAYASNNPVLNTDPNGRQSVPGTIDWQAPGMMEAWQTTGREVTIPLLIDVVVPGGGFINCAIQGCGGGGWAMAALPLVGGEIRGASRVIGAGERVAQAAAKGRRGEEAVRKIADIGDKTAIQMASGKTRVPDGILESVSLSEVKNVARQGLTSQLKDYLQFSKDNNLRFDLYTNEETKISQPLQQLIDAGEINHMRLPME